MGRCLGSASPVQPGPPAIADADSQRIADTYARSVAQPDCVVLMDAAQPVQAVRHSRRTEIVKPSMTTLRAAMPLVRVFILAGLAIALILFGLPAILGIAAAATP